METVVTTERELGRLIASVENLTDAMKLIASKMDTVDERLLAIEKKQQDIISKGVGLLVGFVVVSGGGASALTQYFS